LPPETAGETEALPRRTVESARWLRLGDLLLVNEAWREALAAYEQAGALGARPLDMSVGISTVRMAQEEWTRAETLLRQALADYGGDARLYYNPGIIARRRGEPDTARAWFAQAALLAPDWTLPQKALE
jgi:tetratricopeptide (TPR) repeat protein